MDVVFTICGGLIEPAFVLELLSCQTLGLVIIDTKRDTNSD